MFELNNNTLFEVRLTYWLYVENLVNTSSLGIIIFESVGSSSFSIKSSSHDTVGSIIIYKFVVIILLLLGWELLLRLMYDMNYY